jgi:hypothetical protein
MHTGNTADYLNLGTLVLRPATHHPDNTGAPITVIVSGIGRSGTSMTAAVLGALGIPMGKTRSAVTEDEEFLHSLLYFDYQRMAKLIEVRNQENARWGFKFASLQNHLLPPQMSYFRNPHLIVVMRDPVAISTRAGLSDPDIKSDAEAFANVVAQSADMANFLTKAACPTLLLSYEKFISFPDHAIDVIAAFCGLECNAVRRAQALHAVAPNNPAYIALFHNQYKGHLDGVRDGKVLGWCRADGTAKPVTVELEAGDNVVATALANLHRGDLEAAGVGDGWHAFEIDISNMPITDEDVLRVRVAQTEIFLDGSNLPLGTLRRR